MNVFDLFAKLSLDTSEYDEGLDNAESKGESFGSKLSKGLGTAAKVGGAAIAAVGTAAVAAGAAFVHSMGDVASYGDNIDKMSQKMGISAEAYQEWEAVMQHSGTSMETMKASMKTLANAVESGNDAFARLGITQEELANMSQEDIFEATISGLQNVEDTTERTYLAGQLLGRGATELGALLNTSAEETQAMRDRVHELGGVMSDDAVKAAAQYQDSLQDMQTALSGLKNNMISEFLPAASQVMDGLGKIFSGDMSGLEDIDLGIDTLIQNLTDALPQIAEVGSKIIMGLADAIIKNLPKIAQSATKIIMQLGTYLIENLPVIVKTGLQIISDLALGIADALPELIPTIVDVVIQIVETLIDNLDLIIDGAIELMLGLAEGLITALPMLIDKLPELIEKVMNAVIENLPILIDGLIQLMTMIVENLPTIIQALVDALPTIITAIVNGLIEALPQLIDGAVQLVMMLVENLPTIIMALIQAIPQIIESIVTALAPLGEKLGEVASKAVEAVVNFFKKLPEKIKEWFTKTVNKAKEFGNNLKEKAREAATKFKDQLVNGIKAIPEKVKEIGKNIVDGLKNGIKEKWDAMVQWFTDLGDKMLGKFKSLFGISSPSKEFAKVGKFMVEGLEIGWDKEFSDFQRDLDNIDVDMKVDAVKRSGTTVSEKQPLVVENHIYLEGDAKGIFEVVRVQNIKNTRAKGYNALATI